MSIKKSLRNRRVSEPVKPIPSGNVHDHHFARWFFGLAAVMVLAIGVPVMLWAQTGDKAPVRVSVDADALHDVQMKLEALQGALGGLMKSQQGLEPGQTAMVLPDDGRADCLNDCRRGLKTCKENYAGEVMDGELHPCLTQANSCITKCNDAPKVPVSCQDRCAVALGGCIESVVAPAAVAVGDEGMELMKCMNANSDCLVKACNLPDMSALPENYCMDQCRRMHLICQTGSTQYNTQGLELCDRLEMTCKDRVCVPMPQESAQAVPPQMIKLMHNDGLRPYLSDEYGRALYIFAKDGNNMSECSGACLQNWPAFNVQNLEVGEGLNMADFSIFVRTDGNPQLSFRGAPLYYYKDDFKPMDTQGHGKNGVWFLAAPESISTSKDDCMSDCDAFFNDCKRTDVAPFVCQQNTDQCKTNCEEKYTE
ncbi:MAG: hypothetical protein ACOYUZ_00140 [Patescibacteria group bacterium]